LTRVTRTWFPFRERALASGGIWFSARMGGFIAPMVIGRLTYWLGWRQAFWVLGLIGLAWSVLFFWWFRDHPEEKPGCNEAERALIHEGAGGQASAHAGGHSCPPLGMLAGSMTIWAICLWQRVLALVGISSRPGSRSITWMFMTSATRIPSSRCCRSR